jgi:hypothetical protein
MPQIFTLSETLSYFFMFRLRCGSKQIAEKYFADENKKGRVEFVPVEWRSSLKLDEGVLDLVTPHTVRGVRNVINTSMMDIMYYTSPFYREEVSVYHFHILLLIQFYLYFVVLDSSTQFCACMRCRRQVVCLIYTVQRSCKQVVCDSFRQKL